MAFYETTFIVRPEMAQIEVTKLSDDFVDIFKKEKGQIVKRDYWGLHNLAYPINKNTKGHYVILYTDAPASAVAELERHLRLSEDVIRYLTVRVESHAPVSESRMSETPAENGAQ